MRFNKKKRKYIIIAIIIILFIALLIPFKTITIDDNQTKAHCAILYTHISWINESQKEGYHTVYFDDKYYFFPQNLKSIDDIKKEYYESND